MRRSGCESEAVANVLMQMRLGKTGSAGIVLGKQSCDCCYTDSLPHFHCTRRKLQHPDLLCGQIHSPHRADYGRSNSDRMYRAVA